MSELEILRSTLLSARASCIAATHALDAALTFLADGTPSTTEEALGTDAGGLSVESDTTTDDEPTPTTTTTVCQHPDLTPVPSMNVSVCPDCGANIVP